MVCLKAAVAYSGLGKKERGKDGGGGGKMMMGLVSQLLCPVQQTADRFWT
jgi:hypothetical protein